jgi:SAM-dependent methyltransferase
VSTGADAASAPAFTCPLCAGHDARAIDCDARRYFRCGHCALVSLEPSLRPSPERERAEYDRHRNDPADTRYRAFLARTFDAVRARIAPPAHGLDFGCGPGPALVAMAREAGYVMDAYDPFYAPDPAVFAQRYDFITATEVVEHLFAPRVELDRLWSMLRPGGVLVMQTQRVLDDARFRTWNYRRDPTHVVFFADTTFGWLARRWGARVALPHRDVAVLTRPHADDRHEEEDR